MCYSHGSKPRDAKVTTLSSQAKPRQKVCLLTTGAAKYV